MGTSQEIDVSVGIDVILEHGFLLLEDHQWAKAKRYFDKAIELAPKNAYSYLGRLLVTLKLPTIDALQNASRSFTGSDNFQKAMHFADAELQKKLNNYQTIVAYNLKEQGYQKACRIIETADSTEKLDEAITLLSKLEGYKDTDALITDTKIKKDNF